MKRVNASLIVLCLASCGIMDPMLPGKGIVRGLPATAELLGFEASTTAQNNLITSLMIRAVWPAVLPVGKPLPVPDPNWSLITDAGIEFIGARCEEYIEAVSRYSRERRAERQGLNATGTTAAGIMGLTGAPGAVIAGTAAAFGLATNFLDAEVNSVMYQADMTTIRNIVIQGRTNYLAQLTATRKLQAITTRPAAMMALQGYLMQCAPSTIEANINNAANGSPNAVTAAGAQNSPQATGAPGLVLMGAPFKISVGEPSAPKPVLDVIKVADSNLTAAELALKDLTIDNVKKYQRALGVTDDGNPGQPSPPAQKISGTRAALIEFHLAMRARDQNIWSEAKEPPADFSGPWTRYILGSIGKTSGPYQTPFERFYLTAQNTNTSGVVAYVTPDPIQIGTLRAFLGLAQTPTAGTDTWTEIRPALAKLRPDGKDILDSNLFAILCKKNNAC